MRIEVDYNGRIYGTGQNAKKYKLTISRMWSKELSVKFQFDPATVGQADNYGARIRGGEICLPVRQALPLASAILWFCQQSEYQTNPASIEVIFDEDALENKLEA